MIAQKFKILFVCMGNICRSPAAEGTFRHIAENTGIIDKVYIDSAGTHAYHAGSPPDSRSVAAAARYGIKLNGTARQLSISDIREFSLILAMDRENLEDIRNLAGKYYINKQILNNVRMFRQFDPEFMKLHSLDYSRLRSIKDIPFVESVPDLQDPYYGGPSGFDQVQKIIMRTSETLAEIIKNADS